MNNRLNINIFLNHFWTFIAFLSICIGAKMIHPGLMWIFLGLYIIKMTFRTDGLINVIITLPPIIHPNANVEKPQLDDQFINKYKDNIDEIIENSNNNEQ